MAVKECFNNSMYTNNSVTHQYYMLVCIIPRHKFIPCIGLFELKDTVLLQHLCQTYAIILHRVNFEMTDSDFVKDKIYFVILYYPSWHTPANIN